MSKGGVAFEAFDDELCRHGVPVSNVCEACDRDLFAASLDAFTDSPHFHRPPDRIITVDNPDYEVVTFNNKDGSCDVVIHEKSGREAMHAFVPAPPAGRCIAVIRGAGGAIMVVYRDEVKHAR